MKDYEKILPQVNIATAIQSNIILCNVTSALGCSTYTIAINDR
jgi:hypothetical protein